MASYNQYNPIRWVGTSTGYVAVPSAYKISIQDVSRSNAGRTEDGLMHKEKLTQKVTIELEWQNLSTAETNNILTLFDDEYLNVCYLDPKNGSSSSDYFVTKNFYVGDRSTPAYNTKMGVWSNISFNIIER